MNEDVFQLAILDHRECNDQRETPKKGYEGMKEAALLSSPPSTPLLRVNGWMEFFDDTLSASWVLIFLGVSISESWRKSLIF